MRLTFFILLLANLVLYFWGQGYLGQQDAGREPDRLQRQIESDKLSLVAPAALAPATAPASVCKRIEWLTAGETVALKAAVATLPDWEATQLPRKEDWGHWVAIPALANRATADKKLAELRHRGVQEGEVVEDAHSGPFAVSLGLFRSKALAAELLHSLAKKGVRSAQLLKRDTAPKMFAVELRASVDQLDRKLPELLRPVPQASTQDCVTP